MKTIKATTQYLVVGNGRLSRHLNHALALLGHEPFHWFRGCSQSFSSYFQNLKRKPTHLFLCISDKAIEPFLRENEMLQLMDMVCVHFSGSLVTSLAHSAHPLLTFSKNLYSPQFYTEIPFVIEKEGPEFKSLLPDFPNPHYKLERRLKPLYHAVCVLAGNSTTLLWEKAAKVFEDELNLPPQLLEGFLQAIVWNLKTSFQNGAKNSVLTGPFVREDQETVEKNLNALTGNSYQEVYQAMFAAYLKDKKNVNAHH